jgi:zinc transport system substrate-binding protein
VQDRQKMVGVDVAFVIGVEFDDWAEQLAESEYVQILDLSQGIELKEGEDHEDEAGHEDSHEEHDHEGLDPHYWLAPANAKIIATTVTQKMIAIDPASREYYQTNLSSYLLKLDKLQTDSQQKLAKLENRKLITFHNAFTYFAASMDLEIVTTIEPFPGKEPTAAYLAEVGEIIKKEKIKILFKEPQLSEAVVNALAEDYGAQVYTLDPEGGGVEGIDSYEQLIRYNVNIIAENLDK